MSFRDSTVVIPTISHPNQVKVILDGKHIEYDQVLTFLCSAMVEFLEMEESIKDDTFLYIPTVCHKAFVEICSFGMKKDDTDNMFVYNIRKDDLIDVKLQLLSFNNLLIFLKDKPFGGNKALLEHYRADIKSTKNKHELLDVIFSFIFGYVENKKMQLNPEYNPFEDEDGEMYFNETFTELYSQTLEACFFAEKTNAFTSFNSLIALDDDSSMCVSGQTSIYVEGLTDIQRKLFPATHIDFEIFFTLDVEETTLNFNINDFQFSSVNLNFNPEDLMLGSLTEVIISAFENNLVNEISSEYDFLLSIEDGSLGEKKFINSYRVVTDNCSLIQEANAINGRKKDNEDVKNDVVLKVPKDYNTTSIMVDIVESNKTKDIN